jgi:hypothetical protein
MHGTHRGGGAALQRRNAPSLELLVSYIVVTIVLFMWEVQHGVVSTPLKSIAGML